MTVPRLDTFEHDISSEIKNKEASITDIASAGGEVGNTTVPNATSSRALIVFGSLLLLSAISIVVWLYYVARKDAVHQAQIREQETIRQTQNSLSSMSTTLDQAIGEHVRSVTKSEYGYTVELENYTPVFAYMIKNEDAYADEIASAVGSARDTSTTTYPFMFSDVTISNQNMRVGLSGENMVTYSFSNAKTLLIASSTESILKLRGSTLNK